MLQIPGTFPTPHCERTDQYSWSCFLLGAYLSCFLSLFPNTLKKKSRWQIIFKSCYFKIGETIPTEHSHLSNVFFLEKEMAAYSSVLAWRIPWTEKPGGLWSVGLQRVGHN